MTRDSLLNSTAYLDPITPIVYLEVPSNQVVLFQGFFELYEGLGLVRTLDMRKSLVCVITTASQLEDCFQALLEIRSSINWRAAAVPSDQEKEKYLGYFKNASDHS